MIEEARSEAARICDAAVARLPALAGPPAPAIVAIGLATVDMERAIVEGPAGEWIPLVRDPLLGATVRRFWSRERRDEGPGILLLEPDTEGPLAASLARFGEGLAAVYLGVSKAGAVPGYVAPTGPLGPARLLAGPRWGPHVVVLGPATTIEP